MMNSIATQLEQEHKEKSAKISIIIHLLILLIAWLLVLPRSPKTPEKEDFAVTVEFIDFKESSLSKLAHDDSGRSRPKQEQVKKVEPVKVEKIEEKVTPPVEIPKPEPVIEPQVIDPIVSEILQEDSELEAIEEELEVEDPEPELIEPEPELEPMEDVVEAEEIEEVVEEVEEEPTAPVSEEASESEDAPSNPSSLDGEEGGTGKADEGDGAGASSGNDGDEGMGDEGAGTGEYDGSGNGVFGRKVIYRNIDEAMKSAVESGKVEAKICIDRAGKPTYVEIDEYKSTITDSKTLKGFLKALYGYRYQKDMSAPEEQCGRFAFNLKVDLNKERNKFVANADRDINAALSGKVSLNRFKSKYQGLTPQQLKNLSVDDFKRLFKK